MEGAASKNNPAAAALHQGLDLEMEELLQEMGPPFNKPHQLVQQGDDLLVAIASVEELDAALAAAPPFKGALRGYVLPTASIKDCLLLKAAAEEGWYSSTARFKFSLADHTVVDAKISARASVDQARAELGGVVSMLSSFTGDFTRTGVKSTSTGPLVDTVESTGHGVQQLLESTIVQIKTISERLDSV